MIAIRVLLASLVAGAIQMPTVSLADDNAAPPTTTWVSSLPDLLSRSRPSVEDGWPSLDGATGWLNSSPLARSDLRGKVVLIDFWTYSCINWRRTLPYLRAWSDKYRAQGLVVIGVHSPEFDFEKSITNVAGAVTEMKIDYPVAIDSDHAIWQAFDNQYWPALYVVDAQGHIRHHQFGEGGYEQVEKVIQKLLSEAGVRDVASDLVKVNASGIEVAADWADLKSPENYVGYERTQNFASSGGIAANKSRSYAVPGQLRRNEWALSGNWTVARQLVRLNKGDGHIAYRFHARDLHLVMGPGLASVPVQFRVLIDGRAPGLDHGIDIDEQGNGVLTEQRLYQLIRQKGTVVDRQIEIQFFAPGVEAFSFTFG